MDDEVNDACLEMEITDAIEGAMTDRLQTETAWLERHGFHRRHEDGDDKITFVNPQFILRGQTFPLQMDCDSMFRYWSCGLQVHNHGMTIDTISMSFINGIFGRKMLYTSHNHCMTANSWEFKPADMRNVDILSACYSDWLKHMHASVYDTAKEALHAWCRYIDKSMYTLEELCGSHDENWWTDRAWQ